MKRGLPVAKRNKKRQINSGKQFWKKGSSTIEAAFLLPMILALILFCIYLSYFLYNRLIITQTAYIAALRGSRLEWESAGESYKEAGRACETLLSDRLLFIADPDRQIKVNGKNISVTLKIRQEIPFRGLTGIFTGNRDPEWIVTGKSVKQNPYRFIRDYRMLMQPAGKTNRDKTQVEKESQHEKTGL